MCFSNLNHSQCANITICKCLVSIYNMSNFHPLKVVGRGSETQLQVDENVHFCDVELEGVNFMMLPNINFPLSCRFGKNKIKQVLPDLYYDANYFVFIPIYG